MSKNWDKGEEISAEGLNDQGLKVVAQDTPDMTLKVNAGVAIVDGTFVKYPGGNTGTFTAPVTNDRIDIVSIDAAGDINITQGVEDASPVAPAYLSDETVLAEVYLRAGCTEILNVDNSSEAYLYLDSRPLGAGITLIDETTGAADAGKGIKTDANGLLDPSFLPALVDRQVFTTPGADTWTKPSTATKVFVQLWGGGGSGAKQTTTDEAGGGGGGGYNEFWFDASDLDATEAIVVGAGGAAKTTNGNGNAGGNSSFKTGLIAYGGGAGASAFSGAAGGGGGGQFGAGGNASGTTAGTAGSPGTPWTSAGGNATNPTQNASNAYQGAGGGGVNTSNVAGNGGNSIVGGGGGGGASTAGFGTGGTSQVGGNGGAGSNTAGNAGDGQQPAGGGGAKWVGTSGDSGKGGDGMVIVTSF